MVRDAAGILRQLPDLAGHLKADVTIQDLDRESRVQSDSAAAESMQRQASRWPKGKSDDRGDGIKNRRTETPKPVRPRAGRYRDSAKSNEKGVLAAGRFAPASRLILG